MLLLQEQDCSFDPKRGRFTGGSLKTQQMVLLPIGGSRCCHTQEGCRAGPIDPGCVFMTLVMSLVTSVLSGSTISPIRC